MHLLLVLERVPFSRSTQIRNLLMQIDRAIDIEWLRMLVEDVFEYDHELVNASLEKLCDEDERAAQKIIRALFDVMVQIPADTAKSGWQLGH